MITTRILSHSHAFPARSRVAFAGTSNGPDNTFFAPDQLPKNPPSKFYTRLKSMVNTLFPSTALTPSEQRLNRVLDQLADHIRRGKLEPVSESPSISKKRIYPVSLKINQLPMTFEVDTNETSYYNGFLERRVYKQHPNYILSRPGSGITLQYYPYNKTVGYSDTSQNVSVSSKNRYLRRKANGIMKNLVAYVHQISSICTYRRQMEALKQEEVKPEFRMLDIDERGN